jgi:acyl-CoA synthetase (AMP-forming)/AMP-acid ligase II
MTDDSESNSQAFTIGDRLAHHASTQPHRRVFRFIGENGTENGTENGGENGATEERTYAELDRAARRVAAALRAAVGKLPSGVQPRALLLLPQSAAFADALFGCFYAGVCAVPAHVPTAGRLRQTLPRLRGIAADACADVVVTTTELAASRAFVPELASAEWIAVDTLDGTAATADPAARPDDLAILQYSSGSTGDPRGVMVSHANLMHNEALIEEAFEHTPSTIVTGWLPFQHDMGLIGNVLQPVYAGAECVLMTPIMFLKHPLRWLQEITRHRATTSGAPNFAYEMCVEAARRSGPNGIDGLDLSSWTLAFVGAEPVRAATLARFSETFAPVGFRREAFYPCYGLAEATLMVSGGRRAEAPNVWASGDKLRVSCGRARLGLELAVVDLGSRRRLDNGVEGEIWIRGASVARGYWGKPELSLAAFGAQLDGEGPWLRTGDLGRLVDGELYVTGRLKDVVVRSGAKHAAEDIEHSVEKARITPLRAGACAAFSHDDGQRERLVVVQEVERDAIAPWSEVADQVAAAIVEEGVPADVVLLVRAGSIPRTTSGKVRRGACRALFADGALAEIHRYTVGRQAV